MNGSNSQSPRVSVALSSNRGKTEVNVQLSWRYRLPVPGITRLLIVLLLVAASIAAGSFTHEEVARGVLYGLAGILTGSRPRSRS